MRILVLAAMATLSLASASLAHDHGEGSWINHLRLLDPVTKEWCCNLVDCAPEPQEGISEGALGFTVKSTGELIVHERVLWKSQDGRWWRCRYLAGPEKGKTRCLIGPPRGM